MEPCTESGAQCNEFRGEFYVSFQIIKWVEGSY